MSRRMRFPLFVPAKKGGADGSFENPYLITNLEEWREYVSNVNLADIGKWWRLENDIVLEPEDFRERNTKATCGNLNGAGHIISGTTTGGDKGVFGAIQAITVINVIYNVTISNSRNTSIAFRDVWGEGDVPIFLNCMSLNCNLDATDSIGFFGGTKKQKGTMQLGNIVINGGEANWKGKWEFSDLSFAPKSAVKITNCYSDSSIAFKTRQATPKTNAEINSQEMADTLNQAIPNLEKEYGLPMGALHRWYIKDGKLSLMQGDLPYTPLTAIWSVSDNRPAFYDTGYKPNERTKVKFGCQFKEKQYRSGFICGEDSAWRNKGYSVFIRNPWRMITEWNNGNMGETAVPDLNTPREVEFYQSELYVDGQLIGDGGGNSPFQAQQSLHLFCNSRNGNIQEACKGFAIKDHFDIYEVVDGVEVPIATYIPVLNADGEPCFYDTMSGKYLQAQGAVDILRWE